ncbi:putative F-box/FBD/LRR-repeat protein At4g26350, partial [Bidens hawaiensis]|uniref:putative F-box/FBD/LRR-repeat protein At4g26350 n=1 Tax=Bidens hawaiensis TaxID=980011 RepID=UPI0040491D90
SQQWRSKDYVKKKNRNQTQQFRTGSRHYQKSDLQLRILLSLETKHAFQTSLLSKTWSSKWTYVPVLDFNSSSFDKLLDVFDKFVSSALSVPRSAQLVKLNYYRCDYRYGYGICSADILKEVFDYAFKQRVEELDVNILRTEKQGSWPMIMSHTSWDSLKSLRLESCSYTPMGCSYLGPRSGSFKNLANLHLREVIITDLDPFSGFPALKKLRLISCHLQTDGNTLNVHALHLSELTISYFYIWDRVNRCNLTTPNLDKY